MEMNNERKTEKERPKKKWWYVIDSDMRITSVYLDDVGDHVKWKIRTWLADPKYLREREAWEKKKKKKIKFFNYN